MDEKEKEFHDSFSELAYSSLQNSFPELLENSKGFQVLDSNDQKTKGLGVYALDVGGKHYYIPVFFVKGRLKPLELLYDKQKDVFMPLEKEYVNDIMKSQLADVGENTRLPRVGLSNPNLEIYANPPRTGRTVTASANISARDFLEGLQKESKVDIPLPLFIATSPELVKKAFAKFLKKNPAYTEKLLEFYDWPIIKEALLANPRIPKKPDNSLVIIDNVLDKQASADMSRRVIKDGFAILDKRAMASDAYFTNSISRMESVTDTGMYRIMDSKGDVKNYLVVQKTCDKDRDMGKQQGYHGAMCSNTNAFHSPDREMDIIDLGKGIVYPKCSKSVMGRRALDEPGLLDSIIASMPTADELKLGKKYVFMMRKGEALIATDCFELTDVSEEEGVTKYSALRCKDRKKCRLLIRPGIRCLGRPKEDTIALSKDIKAIPIDMYGGNPDKFSGQSPKMMEVQAVDKGVGRVEIYSDGIEYSVKAPFYRKSGLSKRAVAEALCIDLNMRGKDVSRLIKEASQEKRSSCYIIKQAVPMNYQQPASYGPQYQPQNVAQLSNPPVQQGQYWPEQYYRETYNPHAPAQNREGFRLNIGPGNMAEQPTGSMDSQYAMMGAQTGNKNIMEAGTVMSLSKCQDIDDMVESYIPDLKRAMDRIGRMLFLYFYQADKFADKYNQTELRETEESLRNLFKDMGKVVHKFGTKKAKVHGMIESDGQGEST